MSMRNAAHPGKGILHDDIEPLGVSVAEAARHIGVSCEELNDVVNGKAPVSPEMSIRLYKAFGASVSIRRRLQASYDLAQVFHSDHGIKVKRLGNPLGEVGLPTSSALHPGQVLLHECLEPLGLTVAEAAEHLGVSYEELDDLVNCRASLTPELIIRIDQAFGGHPQKWSALQANYDVAKVAMERAHEIKVRRLWRQDPDTHEPILLDTSGVEATTATADGENFVK